MRYIKSSNLSFVHLCGARWTDLRRREETPHVPIRPSSQLLQMQTEVAYSEEGTLPRHERLILLTNQLAAIRKSYGLPRKNFAACDRKY